MDKSNDKIPKAEWAMADRLAREADRVWRRNERFADMNPEQRRVEIAKETLHLLRAGDIVVGDSGGYCTPLTHPNGNGDYSFTGECQVCALGGMFVAAAHLRAADYRGATATPTQYTLGSTVYAALEPYFPVAQLRVMETAFEGVVIRGNGMTEAERDAGLDFAARHGTRRQRLAAIMRNIIRNGGEFRP